MFHFIVILFMKGVGSLIRFGYCDVTHTQVQETRRRLFMKLFIKKSEDEEEDCCTRTSSTLSTLVALFVNVWEIYMTFV